MPFRIVLDTRRVADFGIGTYIRNLVRTLSRLDTFNQYTLITPSRDIPEFAGLPANFSTALYENKGKAGLAQIGFSMFLRKLPAEVYHIPLNAVPLMMPKPYLVTIHDMSSLLFAAQSGYRNNLRLFYLRRGLLRADQVLAVSTATRHDVENVLRIPASRMRVVYNAPDPVFTPGAPRPSNSDTPALHAPEIQRVLDRYRIHYPFLLYVGRTNPQKNIPRLVEAFAVVRGELQDHPEYKDLRLIIIGDEIAKHPALRHAVIQSRVEEAVRFLGFVPIDTLRTFYQAAAAFVFPSLYEGFGLPILEAMRAGAPVITSNTSCMPEVAGDAALLVDPHDAQQLANAVRRVLDDERVRVKLSEGGERRALEFTWARAAELTRGVYERVARGRA